jgi:hypothetical protein
MHANTLISNKVGDQIIEIDPSINILCSQGVDGRALQRIQPVDVPDDTKVIGVMPLCGYEQWRQQPWTR